MNERFMRASDPSRTGLPVRLAFGNRSIDILSPASRDLLPGNPHKAVFALRGLHLRAALLCLSLLVLCSGLFAALDVSAQLLLVALPISILGVMHGGADPWVAQILLARRPGRWQAVSFSSAYLACMALVLCCWAVAPGFTLTGFLILSLVHFGQQDASLFGLSGDRLAVVVLGAVPIIGPVLGHPGQVAEIFGWLSAADPAELQALLWWLVQPLSVLWLVGAAMLISRLLLEGFVSVGLLVCGMAIVVSAMLVLPPLIAFAAYFCLLHSFGHLIDLAVSGDGPWRQWPLRQWARRLWPATAGAIALGVIGWLAFAYFAAGAALLHESLARAIFWGLAALTVPHVLLHEAARRMHRKS